MEPKTSQETIGATIAPRDDVVSSNSKPNRAEKRLTMKTKKAAKKSTRKAIPYVTIHKLAKQGFGAMEIAKKTDRLIKGDDPAHSIRAILSKMRTVGYKLNGKIVKLKVKRVGFEVKPVKKVVSIKKGQPKKAVPQIDGKTLAAGGGQ